jgi:hypothetical protein
MKTLTEWIEEQKVIAELPRLVKGDQIPPGYWERITHVRTALPKALRLIEFLIEDHNAFGECAYCCRGYGSECYVLKQLESIINEEEEGK